VRPERGREPDDEVSDPSSTLQSLLEVDEQAAPAAAPSAVDAVALLRHLEVSGRFQRDSGIGRLFHPGRLSLRESVPSNSLHVVVEDNRVAAHVDRVSPLGVHAKGSSRYSFHRAVAHNLVGMAQDLVGLLRGRQGDHRCELNCEWVPGEAESAVGGAGLLHPEAAAWSVQIEARVAGALDEPRLRAALDASLGGDAFDGEHLEVVACPDDDDLEVARRRLQHMATAVTEWPPLKVFLVRHPAGDVLMLNVNYAVADASAALRVLHAIASAYAGSSDVVGGLDLLATSDLPVRPAPPAESILTGSAKRAIERLRDVLARPALLAADQAEDRPGYGFHLVRLSAEDTAHVVDVKRSGTSRNVLMAALHLAMGDWNLQHGTPGRRLHVLAPVNLRPPEWEKDPIANFSVTARVSTTRGERKGPASALKAVTAQTTRNKRTRTGIALLAALERSGLLPMWAKQSTVVLQRLTNNVLVDNAMLCNLGVLDEAPAFGPDVGDASELWFSTPTRSPLTLCVGAVTLNGRLHLTFRYPHRLFGPDAARRFAECYLRQVRLVAESRS
jgi:NRPS condensation-like uncharacterized protein